MATVSPSTARKGVKALIRTVRDFVSLPASATAPPLRLMIEADSIAVRHDDSVYEKYRDVWERQPRGLSRIFVRAAGFSDADAADATSDSDGGDMAHMAEYEQVHSMNGLRKFGYESHASYGYRTAGVRGIALEKENGENGQISGFMCPMPEGGSVPMWAIGSKNVPIVVRADRATFSADLELPVYKKERYGFAVAIARLFHRACAERFVSDDAYTRMHAALSATRMTVVCEAIFLTSQHLVRYERDELRAFALSPVPGTPSTDGLTGMPPLEARDFLSRIGFPATFPRVLGDEPLGTPAYDALCRTINALRNSEGAVMYSLDASGRTCFMHKVKSFEYVAARRARTIILAGLPNATLATRMHELARLDVPIEVIERGVEYYSRFATWLRGQDVYKSSDRAQRFDVQSQWVTLNDTFMASGGTPASASAGGSEPRVGKAVIMMQGVPLTGKSTLSRALQLICNTLGEHAVWLNQDEMAAGKSGARGAYLEALKHAMEDAHVTHVLLDKTNVDARNRADYTIMGVRPTVTIRMVHPDDAPGETTHLLRLCEERFATRGAAHRSLRVPSAASTAAAAVAAASDSDADVARVIAGVADMSVLTPPPSSADKKQKKSKTKGKDAKKSEAVDIRSILTSFASIEGAADACSRRGDAVEGVAVDDDSPGFIVEYNVCMSREDGLRNVWSILASNGVVPDTPVPPHVFSDALAINDAYEAHLATSPPVTRFWGLSLDADARVSLLRALPASLPLTDRARSVLHSILRSEPTEAAADGTETCDTGGTLTLLTRMHHTLMHFGGGSVPTFELAYAAHEDEERELQVCGVAWDDNCAAALVLPSSPVPHALSSTCSVNILASVNPFPHVTIALGRTTQASYSNTLLQRVWAAGLMPAHVACLYEGMGSVGDGGGVTTSADGVRSSAAVEGLHFMLLPHAAAPVAREDGIYTLALRGTVARNPA